MVEAARAGERQSSPRLIRRTTRGCHIDPSSSFAPGRFPPRFDS
jgi:hypothetical protein